MKDLRSKDIKEIAFHFGPLTISAWERAIKLFTTKVKKAVVISCSIISNTSALLIESQ